MAFNNLASNQMVSFTDAQSSGFALRSGQSHVTSNQCMTKLEAQTKYVLASEPMSGYANNQLTQKSQWQSGVIGNAFTVYLGDHGIDATCVAHPQPWVRYSNSTVFAQGITLYYDEALTQTYNNTFRHWHAETNSTFYMSSDGVVGLLTSCVSSFRFDGQRGALTCVGGQVALFNPVNVTVYSSQSTLFTGARLYNDAGLTVPYSRGNIVKITNQLYQMDSNGYISTYYDVGDPC